MDGQQADGWVLVVMETKKFNQLTIDTERVHN